MTIRDPRRMFNITFDTINEEKMNTRNRLKDVYVPNRNDLTEFFYTDQINPLMLFGEVAPKYEDDNDDTLSVGGVYTLPMEEYDGLKSESPLFKLHGIVKEYNGYPINAVVMQRMSGTNSRMFALNRTQCKDLGIPFENGLQLLPISLGWKKSTEKKMNESEDLQEFNPNDLSTFPRLDFIFAKLKGFRSNDISQLITPNNSVLFTSEFLHTFRVFYVNKHGRRFFLPHLIITRQMAKMNQEILCDTNGDIYLVLDLRVLNICRDDLKNVDPKNVFCFEWMEKVWTENTVNEWDTVNKPLERLINSGYKPLPQVNEMVNGMIRFDGNIFERYENGDWFQINV